MLILVSQFAGLPVLGDIAGIAMLLFLLLEFSRQRRFARVRFLALTGIGMIGVLASAHPWTLVLESWRRGASYGAFFLALSSLRDAAETSPLVRRCGRHLVAQPPGLRYAALTGRGHLFGVILSYDVIGLIGTMVMRANTMQAAGDRLARTAAVLGRRCGRFFWRVPQFRAEATVRAGSGFMGAAVGGALPASALSPVLAHLPGLAVPLLVPVLLIGTGQLGLNPVAVIAMLGAALPDPARFGIVPAVLAFACMLGWGLCVNMTPMSASAITTARWAGVSP